MKSATLSKALGFAAGIGLAMAACSQAQGASITYETQLTTTSANSSGTLPKFDLSFGTLNFVQISYDLKTQLIINFENGTSSAKTSTIESNIFRLVGHHPVLGDNTELSFQQIGQDVTVPRGTTALPGLIFATTKAVDVGFSHLDSFDSRGVTVGSSTVQDFDKSTYVGSGNFQFIFNALLDDPLEFSGLQPKSISYTRVEGELSITYDYNDGTGGAGVSTVPIPAALPLMTAALAAFGLFVRRKKSS